ncbi:MAG: hypothetical protein IT270_07910 [Saprospiraceae bacterium]|nr:hypothetical protein [Saprospiraceae bacterium]
MKIRDDSCFAFFAKKNTGKTLLPGSAMWIMYLMKLCFIIVIPAKRGTSNPDQKAGAPYGPRGSTEIEPEIILNLFSGRRFLPHGPEEKLRMVLAPVEKI